MFQTNCHPELVSGSLTKLLIILNFKYLYQLSEILKQVQDDILGVNYFLTGHLWLVVSC